MAKKYAYHVQHLTTNNEEDNVNRELFGSGVVKEISKAEKVLNDFASYPEYDKLRQNLSAIILELHACTQCGQPAQIMRRVRRQYM